MPPVVLLVLAVVLAAPSAADARVTRIEIERVESPTFDGRAFGDVGPYEKLVGRMHGEVDPDAPDSAVITDIELAPRNARGMVEYAADLIILRPVDRARGNGRLFYEANNRGRLLSLNRLNGAPTATSDPTSAEDAGNGFLLRQGYTFVASGWDATASSADGRLNITLPVAVNPDGSPIVGPSLEELVIDDDATTIARLTYPAATRDTSQATLTVRTRYTDAPQPLDDDAWEYADAHTIRLLPAGTAFRQGSLYHLTYPATEPLVAGLGFAAVRDAVAFLRHAAADDAGSANPLAGQVRRAYAFAISQPARFLRDFVHYGFNRDGAGRRVFDGVLNWIGGASGAFVNYRFAQPHRTQRQHTARWFPERPFPFAYNVTHDPVTGRTDGRLRRCLEDDTCPQILEANSSNEYWVKASSLLHTDTLGDDLPDPPNVRLYLFSSFPHSGGSRQRGHGICQQPRNTLAAEPVLRALLVALDAWVSSGAEPPASRIPRRTDGTLVEALPREHLGFPAIPGVHYDGLLSTGDLLDFGPGAGDGILSTLPPTVTEPYPALVPRTDADGNDLAGIRVPALAAPLATYTGWAVRAAGYAEGDLCDAAGQEIAFAATRAERLAQGDPRPSIEERYGGRDGYVAAVEQAVRGLQQDRLLLAEDAERLVAAAQTRSLD